MIILATVRAGDLEYDRRLLVGYKLLEDGTFQVVVKDESSSLIIYEGETFPDEASALEWIYASAESIFPNTYEPYIPECNY